MYTDIHCGSCAPAATGHDTLTAPGGGFGVMGWWRPAVLGILMDARLRELALWEPNPFGDFDSSTMNRGGMIDWNRLPRRICSGALFNSPPG